jgi:hypothetical protein
VKHWLDGAAVLTGVLSFFKAVPWPEIAGFLSCVWLVLQIGHWIYRRLRDRK